MSMLAEKRRKQTWILNPRSTAWSEDCNKYGQRMLEKMGWKPGKGLGVNEQGVVNALRVKYKSDLRGLGCDSKIEDWTKTQEEFNALLGELAGNEKDSKVGSLEKTSKNIRNRIHYHKFTRGKDLSRYSAKDLDSILGLNNLICSKNIIEESVNKANCENQNFSNWDSDFLKNKEKEEELLNENLYNVEGECNKRKSKKKKMKEGNLEYEGSLMEVSLEEVMESPEEVLTSKKRKKKRNNYFQY